MNDIEELAAVQKIREKQEKGEALTEREETILAYSPYGCSSVCACRAINLSGVPEDDS